jgi:hypothetical protein
MGADFILQLAYLAHQERDLVRLIGEDLVLVLERELDVCEVVLDTGCCAGGRTWSGR